MSCFELTIDQLPQLFTTLKHRKDLHVVILQGDLAAGKTTFVKHFVRFCGVDDEVSSPTFSLQNCYSGEIYHYDIYNHGLEHFISLGLLEELEKDGIHFIEWGDDALIELLKSVGIDTVVIKIDKCSDTKRCYEVIDA